MARKTAKLVTSSGQPTAFLKLDGAVIKTL